MLGWSVSETEEALTGEAGFAYLRKNVEPAVRDAAIALGIPGIGADPVADRIMTRIATDENLHMVFYRDILHEAMKVDPSAAIEAIAAEVIAFEMPGAGVENFTRKAAQMAKAGIYDLRIHHDEVVWPLLRHWGVFEAENLTPAAEARREELRRFLVGLDAQASRYEARRAQSLEREAARVG